jgi:tetratricopeptide (TPR) repeat protein
MRNVFVLLAVALVASTAPSLAADPKAAGPAAAAAPASAGETLDTLFAELKRERNPQAAERIAKRIWNEWYKSGSASIDLMMKWSNDAVAAQKYDIALDFLDQVVTLQPGFAEGWNRRATVHFLMRQFGKSMADIEHTLELEPRHFGALSGMAQIMKETGRKELALSAWQRVIDIYPMMRSAQNEIATLSEELAGESI